MGTGGVMLRDEVIVLTLGRQGLIVRASLIVGREVGVMRACGVMFREDFVMRTSIVMGGETNVMDALLRELRVMLVREGGIVQLL